ncbi:MAG: hypothetical protein P8Y75_10240 [Nitrospirota bacterium]
MRNAPESPPMEVKNDTTRATRGGTKMFVLTPETGKTTLRKSIPSL